jgi:hypothetical protein
LIGARQIRALSRNEIRPAQQLFAYPWLFGIGWLQQSTAQPAANRGRAVRGAALRTGNGGSHTSRVSI